MQQIALRSDDADLAVRDLDALGERSEMVAAITAASDPYPLASGCSKLPHHGGRDGLMAVAFDGVIKTHEPQIGFRGPLV